MSMKNVKRVISAILRKKAERALKFKSLPSASTRFQKYSQHLNPTDCQATNSSEEELRKLAFDLKIHRLELKMQSAELRLSKEEAERSAERYTELYDFAPSGYFTLSTRGIILELNFAGAQMLGKERSELRNSQFSQYISIETLPKFNIFLEEIFSGNVKEFCEITITSDRNIPIYVFLSGMASQEREQCLITAVDITTSKLAEEALRKSEEKFRNIFENVHYVFYQTKLDGTIVDISPSVKYFSDFERSELIGKQVQFLYFSESDRDLLLNEIMKNGDVYDYELRIKNKNGKILFVSLNARLIYTSDNQPDHIDGSLRDITRRKQAEEEVIKLQKAIENTKASVVITDRDGKIEYANPYFSYSTGYSREEYTGKNPRILKSGYHSKEFYTEFWNTINSGQTWEGEFYNRKKNGQFYWENAIVSPVMSSKNEINHFVAIKTDITSVKKINLELIKAKERAEESDNLKTAFLNNISHEIRTPFNGILGFLSILQNDDVTINERREYISLINKSAFRLMNTINDIAEISEIQTGGSKVNLTRISINSLIQDLFTRFKPETENKGLDFTSCINLPHDIVYLISDVKKLNTVLNYLINNAIKFTKAGSVALGIRLKEEVKDAPIEFSIEDTGIGIAENKLETIFERFRQADDSSTRQYEGSGLGLTIAKAYVEMLGGTIWGESTEGKGSKFSFTIPCNCDPAEKLVAADISVTEKGGLPAKSLKILIAEDDLASSMLLKLAINPFCKEIISVKTGIEAVEACRNHLDIDLVFMDIKMPEMDGAEAVRQIRHFNPDVVIFAQTAYALSNNRVELINAGCNDYISKPVRKDQLLLLIKKYF